MAHFFAKGKLLLSSEYAVLLGSQALAIPTKLGQHMEVLTHAENNILWESYDHENKLWFACTLSTDLALINTTDTDKAHYLQKVLRYAFSQSEQNPEPFHIRCTLEFPRNWGLGSSSSLIALIAQWLQIDAMDLFFNTSTGSGYDVACATAQKPLLYHLKAPQQAHWEETNIPHCFKETYFIHLNQKQTSSQEVKKFLKNNKPSATQIALFTKLTQQLTHCNTIEQWHSLVNQHEEHMAQMLQYPTVKNRLFSDFKGSIKSLGAWGGDFIWANGQDVKTYFSTKGYTTILSFEEMVGKGK